MEAEADMEEEEEIGGGIAYNLTNTTTHTVLSRFFPYLFSATDPNPDIY